MKCVAALSITLALGLFPELASAQLTATTTVLSASPASPALGTPVQLTATVSPGTPTGTVSFFDGANYLGVAPISNAVATLSTLQIGAGRHRLTARYNGDPANSPSVSAVVALNVTAGVGGGFAPGAPVPVGTMPVSIAYADLNGDLKIDLVTANENSNNVTVALGNGNGTFQTGVTYAVGTKPTGVAIADVNGDGKPDLIVANQTDSTVSILLGNGDGTFQASVSYPVGTGSRSVAVGDFNNDGFPDLAVTDTGANQVSILLNTGTGTFGAPTAIAINGSPKGLAVGDFNGDGHADLAVANSSTSVSHVTIILGNGDGTFGTPTNLGVDSGPVDVIAGDFNGDGKTDLAIACFNTNTADVLLGNGDGTFGPAIAYAAGTGPFSLVASDFNGDLNLDLAVADQSAGTVSILIGVGDGTFGAPVSLPTGTAPQSLVAADFNGDSRADLAVANSGSNNVTILLGLQPTATALTVSPNPAAPGQTVTLTATVGNSGATGTVSFYDGSALLGTVPLVAGSASLSTSSLSSGAHALTAVYSGDSNFATSTSPVVTLNVGGIVTPTLTVSPTTANLGSPVTMTVTVSPSATAGNVTFYDGSTFLAQTTLAGGQASYTTSLLSAGTHNIVARFDGGSGSLPVSTAPVTVLIVSAPGGGFTPPVPYTTGTGATATLFGDFNHDGIPDLAVANYLANTVSILLGNPGGTFQAAVNIPVGTNPDALAAGDFNGDGVQDLLVANYNSANVSLLLGNPDGSFQTPISIATGAMPSGIAVGDFNLDGFADFAVSENGTNNVSIYLGNGNGTFAAPTLISVGGGLKGIAAAGLHGLLAPDLVVAAGSGVYVLLNNGGGTFAAPALYPAGAGPIAVAVADLGNGVPDLIVVNSLSNNVSILIGNGDGTFKLPVNYAVGVFPQSVAVGDFNGDGKLDLAVANEGSGNGTGSVSRLIGNGDGTFQNAVNYPDGANGTPTSVVTEALNGTGQADLAVSNFANGTVDILFALNASAVTLTANPNPDPNGSPVTLTATVAPNTATGTVSFFAGSLALGSAPVIGGVATLTVSIPAGNQSLTAVYSGDTVFGPSTSPAVLDVIGQIPTAISLSVSPATATFGTPVTFTATVGTPGVTGYVTFLSGTTVVGASPLNGGVATLQSSLLPAGHQTITARFDGSGNFASSSSATAALNVVAAQGYSFDAPIAVPVGFPLSVVASDFNRDGKVDLAVANSGVSILLGKGDGTFNAGQNLNAGSGPTQVVTADFNADGNADLAVSDSSANAVNVLLGNGDGSFQSAVAYTAGSGPSSLTVADFNGDGIADIAVANRNDGTVSILQGLGNGTFASAVSIAVGANNIFIASGDFNHDGAPDLVVADFSAGVVWLLLNNGNGTFAAPVSFAAGSAPVSITVGDFNGDGLPDIAVADQSSANSVAVLLGTGVGSFQPVLFFAAGTSPQYITSSDFNGDGILDLLVANQTGTISVLLGNGNGLFQPPLPFPTGADPVSLAVASFTGNGKAQIAAASLGSNTVSILLDGPAGLTAVAGASQSVPAESTFPTQFAVQTTGFGVPVSGIPVSFAAPPTGASGIFNGAGLVASVVSGANGIATAPFFTANTFAGPYTVTASTGTSTVSLAPFSLTNTVTSCSYSVSASSLFFDSTGGTSTLSIATLGGCGWSAVSPAPWITFSNPSGSGAGTATASIAPNSTGVARTATILVGGQVLTVTEAATAQIFADVPPSAYYFDAANLLYAKGITSGCGVAPLVYCPTQSISRAQMAVFLVRSVYGSDNFTASSTPYFTDVPAGSFGFQWIQKLYELGITAGCGPGLFCPNDAVTRSQMAVFLVRVRLGAMAPFNYPLTPFFTDVQPSGFAFQWIQRIKEDQITSGCSVTTYCPDSDVTRGDMAVLLLRAAYNLLMPAGYPAISQISQSSIGVGQSATLTITGVNTNFIQGTVALMPLPNITFGAITVTSPTSLTVPVMVSPSAVQQHYSITTVSGFEEDVLPNGLTVTP